MSQDHLFSAIKRPRDNPYGSSSSGIPQPASAAKRMSSFGPRPSSISNPRMSLAPCRGLSRPSVGGDMGRFSNAVKRESTATKFSSRKSFAPGSSQPPPPSTVRRGSQYGRPSMAVSAANSLYSAAPQVFAEDPRPLKTAAYRQRAAAQIQDYLTRNGFEMEMKHNLTPKSLISPTQKDFQTIFEWLYHRIDPNHRIVKVETECLNLLKMLRYPYPHTITKSQLSAVGSQNAWPQFLGMLHWLMELAQITERITAGEYDHLAEEAGFDTSGDRIAFRFATKCYNAWLVEQDDHSEFEREMAEAYAQRDEAVYVQLEALEAENAALLAELKELEAQGEPLKKLKKQQAILEDDKRKFQTYNDAQQTRLTKMKGAIEALNEEVIAAKQEQVKLEEEKAVIKKKLDEQGLTPEEIDRMNLTREKLERNWKEVQQELEEAKLRLAQTEIETEASFSALKRAVSRYSTLAYKIGFTPSTAANAGGKDYDLVIKPLQNFKPTMDEGAKYLVDPQTGYMPSQILNQDLRNIVKPALQKLKSGLVQQIHEAQDEASARVELSDKITDALQDKKEDIEALEAKVAAAANEYEELKENLSQESTRLTAALEKQSAQLQSLRLASRNALLEAEQRLQAITIECDQLYRTHAAVREKLHAQTARIVEEVVAFKLHIQGALGEYEEWTEQELMEFVGKIDVKDDVTE